MKVYHLIKMDSPVTTSPSDPVLITNDVSVRKRVSVIMEVAFIHREVLGCYANSITYCSSIDKT